MSAREAVGAPEPVRFQEADGSFSERWLAPVLDENGGRIRYTPVACTVTAVASVDLTADQRRVLVEVVTWSRRGAWSAAARFDAASVRALRMRGLVHGEARLWATRAGADLITAGL